ncbi:MAG: radical SAM protein [Bacteroidaceae bacterium]|nr:radical SAM protein [Bacteroidaceae bacterium]
MVIMLTSRCHMGCKHCMQDSTAQGRHMTRETFDRVLAFVREAEAWLVSVTGGEPTEHPEWYAWTKELLRIGSVKVLVIVTNGTWIEDKEQRIRMARLLHETKGRVIVQVYSNPLYYPKHEWTVEHEQQFRSIGISPNFTDPIFMQDLGRARSNCREETEASSCVPSCINSHLLAVQAHSMHQFLLMAGQAAKFCRPLIDPDGAIHMSESWLCPAVANISDGCDEAFRKMRQSRPCRGCRLYRNFERLHPAEMKFLG